MMTFRFRARSGNLEPVPLAEETEFDVSMAFASRSRTAVSVLAVVERLPDIDPSIVDEFEDAIELGKLPASSAR